MKRITCAMLGLAVLFTTAVANGGELTDPVEILKRLDAAARAVKVAQYEVHVETTGAAKGMEPDIRGTFLIGGDWGPAGPTLMRATLKAERKNYALLDATIGCNEDGCYLTDHRKKTVTTGDDPGVFGRSQRYIFNALMGEYIHPSPFTDEINAQKQELLGSKNIDGEDCYIVRVVYDTPGTEENKATWYISKKDFLPRARHDHLAMSQKREGARVKTVTKLVVNEELDDDAFALQVPDGYEGGPTVEKAEVEEAKTKEKDDEDTDKDKKKRRKKRRP